MKNGKIKLAMVMVFLSGIVIGAVGGLVTVRAVHQKWVRSKPEHKVQVVAKRLERRLKLREDQLPAVRKSVQTGLFKMGVLQLYAGKQFFKILEDTAEELEPALDTEQQEELRNMLQMLRDHVGKQSPLAAGMLQEGSATPAAAEK
ncbi:MAG: hypothetical protein K9M45_11795 [Kiritimatiellales bacterium]|nr:hypothetical protein [Kiritimatiellales bacterium]